MTSGQGVGGKDFLFFERLTSESLTMLQWGRSAQIGLLFCVFFSFIFERGEENHKGWGLGLGELDSECDQNVLCEILK